ncbi:SPARC [Culicoides brevitarsis]|uniref:SPARC n=1 Tax=Culicoides brevitarsis TaxID=469753 RepID=UPI00307BC881
MKKFLAIFLFALFVTSAIASDEIDELDDFDADDDELLREIEAKHVAKEHARENEAAKVSVTKLAEAHAQDALVNNKIPIEIDLCAKVHCSAGKICQIIDDAAQCVCVPECPEVDEPRRKVCTNLNETWASDCEVHRQRCLCEQNDPKCTNKEAAHVHIDYYGECRELPECSDDEMKDFPRRMREWLFNVMIDLATRNELPEYYITLIHDNEKNLTKRWADAAVWKFCDLDVEGDKTISRHELFPIRAPLLTLEHCIAPFLETCDENDDHRISLKEWGKCLEIETDELTEKCANMTRKGQPIEA